MQCGTVGIAEPVTRIEWEKLDLGAIREIRRFVQDEAPVTNASLDRHWESVAPGAPPNKPLQPTSGASASGTFEAIVNKARG